MVGKDGGRVLQVKEEGLMDMVHLDILGNQGHKRFKVNNVVRIFVLLIKVT